MQTNIIIYAILNKKCNNNKTNYSQNNFKLYRNIFYQLDRY